MIVSSSKPETKSIKQVYDQIGKQFSASRGYIWPDLKPFLSKVSPGSSVLDVGCGNGRLLIGLPSKILYTGVDFSSALLNEAKKAYPKAKFISADITKKDTWNTLPRYDYIFCVAVIHHLASHEDHLSLITQIKKHLKPDGKCLITAWNLWQPKYHRYHFDLQTKLQDPHHVYIPFQGVRRFHFAYTRPYLKNLIRQAHLDLIVEKNPRNYLLHNFSKKH